MKHKEIREDPLKEVTTCSSISPGDPRGQKSLPGYSPWDLGESDMTEHSCKQVR